MPISFMTTALLVVSLLTNLTVEGIKKLLEETNTKYSSNVLAAILSVVLSCLICVIHLVLNDVGFSSKIVIEIVVLMYLSFLVSTVGYDKVVQTIKQIQNNKEV